MNKLIMRDSSISQSGEVRQPIFNQKEGESMNLISRTRQKIITDIKAHVPVIALIRDGMHHLQNIIYLEEMYIQKEKMIIIFSQVFKSWQNSATYIK